MTDGETLFKFFFAFVFVMGLMFLLAYVLKRAGLAGHSMLPGGKRRLKVIEHLPIDHRRRLLLVRRDDREHLLILSPTGETVVETNIPAAKDAVVDMTDAEKEQKHA
jgi:flagellar protein FliO/FliZ